MWGLLTISSIAYCHSYPLLFQSWILLLTDIGFVGVFNNHIYIFQANKSVSKSELKCCITTPTSYIHPQCVVNKQPSRYLQHKFSHPMLWLELQPNTVIGDSAGSFVPLPVIHLLLGDTAAGLSSNSLEPVCFVSGCLTQHSGSGIMAWRQEQLNSCSSISSHYIPSHYSSPWGGADRGTQASVWSTSSHSVEVAIHGNRRWYSLMDH